LDSRQLPSKSQARVPLPSIGTSSKASIISAGRRRKSSASLSSSCQHKRL
jgi:hypothetical protein